MHPVRRLALSLALGSIFLAPSAFAVTNREAMCAPALNCIVRPGSTPSCGSGATCNTSPQLLNACGSGITASGEGRCLTAEQQACLTDAACIDREVGAAPTSNPPTVCCTCTNGTQQMCAQFTDISTCGDFRNSQQYQLASHQMPNPVSGLNCQPAILNASQCRPTSQGGVCPSAPATLSAILASNASSTTASSPSVTRQNRPAQVPALGVAIPGLTFSAASNNSNFLAQYIAAMYRFAVGAAFIAATIMVTYGGFRYLIGASTGDVATGKTIIKDSLIGMLLVLSAYVILNTVNPATLNLNLAERTTINEIDLDSRLQVTSFDTGDNSSEEDANPSGQTIGQAQRDSHGILYYTDCPVQLDSPFSTRNPATNPRVQEFRQKFVPSITSQNLPIWECAQHVAAAAAKCNVYFGSCGATGNYVNYLCGGRGQGHERFNVMGRQDIRNLLQCGSADLTYTPEARETLINSALERAGRRYDNAMKRFFHTTNPPADGWTRIPRGDFNEYRMSRQDFVAAERRRIETASASTENGCLLVHPPRERVMQALSSVGGWPQTWYDSLQPGDQYWIYNGNYGDTFGMHTQIFMGWINQRAGLARVVHGGVGPFVQQANQPLRGTSGILMKVFTNRPRNQ